MTGLLQKAFEVASRLPIGEQDAIATMVLEEIASEAMWEESFKNSQGWLERSAEKALAEFRAGKTRLLDVGSL